MFKPILLNPPKFSSSKEVFGRKKRMFPENSGRRAEFFGGPRKTGEKKKLSAQNADNYQGGSGQRAGRSGASRVRD
jgi:hypothetical protein